MKNVFRLMVLFPVLSSVTVQAMDEQDAKNQLVVKLQALEKKVVAEERENEKLASYGWRPAWDQEEQTVGALERIYSEAACILEDDVDMKQEEAELKLQAAEICSLHDKVFYKDDNEEVVENFCSLGDSFVQRLAASGLFVGYPSGSANFSEPSEKDIFALAAYFYRTRCYSTFYRGFGYSDPIKGATQQGAVASAVLEHRRELNETHYRVMKTETDEAWGEAFVPTEKFVERFFDDRAKLKRCLKNSDVCGKELDSFKIPLNKS